MRPNQTLDPSDLVYEMENLRELMAVIYDLLMDMDYVKADGSRNSELDRVSKLHKVSFDLVANLGAAISHFDIPGTYVRGAGT